MIVMPETVCWWTTRKSRPPPSSSAPRATAVAAIRGELDSLPCGQRVEGLQANSVWWWTTRQRFENQENDSVAGLSNNQLSARRNLEQYLGKKAEGMLERALGPGQAVVRVAAEINWDTITRTEEKFDPDGQVARSTTLNDETTTTTTDAGGGAAGVASNVANSDTNATSSSTSNNSQTKKKVTQSQ
jgi:flagellar M-ring protein FliF